MNFVERFGDILNAVGFNSILMLLVDHWCQDIKLKWNKKVVVWLVKLNYKISFMIQNVSKIVYKLVV